MLRSIPLYVYVTVFIHSPIDRQLDCFHSLAVTNNTAMNCHVKSLCGCALSPLGKYLGEEQLVQMLERYIDYSDLNLLAFDIMLVI